MPANQQMPTKLEDLRTGSDLHLFTGGGCHIFAAVLLHKLPDEGYSLALIVETDSEKALHVVAQKDDLFVAALGVRPANDLLAMHAGYRRKAVRRESVSCAELFAKVDETNSSEPKNKWGFHLHPNFVKKCENKAFNIIEASPERYQVSLFRQGQQVLLKSGQAHLQTAPSPDD